MYAPQLSVAAMWGKRTALAWRKAIVGGVALFGAFGASELRSAVSPNALPKLEPSNWAQVATVDAQFLSFNIEMAEVTGGEFWAPYDDPMRRRLAPRAPLDLRDQRLGRLAKALSPAMVRVSGTWANSTYIPELTERAPASPPAGFRQVLTQSRWRALTSLVNHSGNSLLLSFPASAGARDAQGQWSDSQARRLVALTRANRSRIKAVEFINEPNLVNLGALPNSYSATEYARDFRTFHAFARRELPEAIILGHSSSGRGGELPPEDIAREAAGLSDAVSYHFYGALSERCLEYGNQTSSDAALTEGWLDRTTQDLRWYTALRDRFDPGKPIWLTETAQAACGGDRWASSFRDGFRFVDQLGRLAQAGVQVVAHNTLASGDYALIDRESVAPRPNYWLAWLWKKTMDRQVLRPNIKIGGFKIYAHCARGQKGAVTAVLIELSGKARRIQFAGTALAWIVNADQLDSNVVRINGNAPQIARLDSPVSALAKRVRGAMLLPPHSITFVQFPTAGGHVCT